MPAVYRSAHEAALALARQGAAHHVGQFPPTLHEVEQEQETVRAKAAQIEAALNACVSSGKIAEGDPLLAQWKPLQARAYAYANQQFGPWGYLGWLFVTPNDLEAGKQLERDMAPWFSIAANCKGSLPSPAPLPPSSTAAETIEKTFKGVSTLLFYWLAWELMKGAR